MLDLVPARFARPDPSVVGAILVEPLASGDGARVLRRHDGRETLLGHVALPHTGGGTAVTDPDEVAGLRAMLDAAVPGGGDTGVVLLRLPPGSALQRDVTLPLGAEAALERVLTYEMDRLTPFAAADVFFAWTVLRRDREAGRLRLRLSLIPKAPLLPMLEACRAAGAGPQAIEVELPPDGQAPAGLDGRLSGIRLSIPLAHERPAAARRERRMLALAGCGCAVLAVVAALLPFMLQAVASSRLDRDVAALRPRVGAVQALHRRLAGGSAGADLVEGERHRLGDALQVVAAMTRVLPDDSFLTDLTLRQGQLTISGQSPAAARLIPAISADPNFTAPAFSAPVTRIEGQNTDLFSIKAGVAR